MKLQIKILESDAKIANTINKAILPQLNKTISKIFRTMEPFIQSTVMNGIMDQPEYNSLISGELRGEFGIPDAGSRVSKILETIQSSIYTEYQKPFINGSKIKGGFFIGIVRNDFRDILSLPESVLITENNSSLEWLKWLLLEGDKTIITGFEFKIGNNSRSRTGQGIMSQEISGSWRVPPAYAGQIENNWITRAIDGVSTEIENKFVRLLQKM